MSKTKRLTPAQQKELKKIKKDADTRKNLQAFATANGLTYEDTQAKWYYLTKLKKQRKAPMKKSMGRVRIYRKL